jgi:protein SCO1/2
MKMLIALAAIAACSGKPASEPSVRAPVAPAPAPAAEPMAAAVVDAPSIYDLPITVRDAADREVGIDVARGKPVLITMFYASCPVACPVLIDDLKRTLAALPPAVRAEVRVVLVSFDPERDTPEQLRALAATRGLDAQWTLAAARPADARALAAVLGIKYRKLESGEFFHSATIVALDRQGRPVVRATGFGQQEALIAALE